MMQMSYERGQRGQKLIECFYLSVYFNGEEDDGASRSAVI